MKYVIDKQSDKYAYITLYKQIRDDIINGVYKFGEKLPSKRLVAEETGVSVITVERAYTLLVDEGYIEGKQRSGYFVIYSEDENYSVAEETQVVYHKKYTSDTFSFPYSVIARSMRRVISDYGELLMEKSENFGTMELRQSISRYLNRSRGIVASPEQIFIGSGAEYLYGMIVEFLGREKIWGIENPSYQKIYQVYKAKGVNVKLLPLGKNGITSKALKNSNVDVLHISPYRSYPSGVTASASKRREYITWSQKNNGIIVEDDFESEFTLSKKTEETLFSLSDGGNVIYINTFSKTISPSLRVAYMVLPQNLCEDFKKALGFYSCTVPAFEQYLIAHLINTSAFERHINSVRRKRRKESTKTGHHQ
ncbi:MAG: PLP-dependent aminotransferase family protein [Ruminococcaceae bacterium]|nr:PLP-dependent aminotransferase family protein [Oscillospiraceae bacterium]